MKKIAAPLFVSIVLLLAFVTCNSSASIDKTAANEDDTSKTEKQTTYERIRLINGTFLGNEKRNFYGDSIPSKLDIIWQTSLGSGKTVRAKGLVTWSGAGWTGQPLYVIEDSVPYLIQGAYDHHLKKINAQTGKIVWQYAYDDVIKGTGTIWKNSASATDENKYIILQGSRRGLDNTTSSKYIPSYRAISYLTGKELWRYNSVKTRSQSRDVDGSALVIDDYAYLGLENGLFIVFNPDPDNADTLAGMLQPQVLYEDTFFTAFDIKEHGSNLVIESSPSRLNDRVYVTSGTGHVYGYNIITKSLEWDFYIGADLDGSPTVTSDSCILVSLEKEYITGCGGVFKLNPALPPESAVVWYYPVENKAFAEWKGGVLSTVTVNDYYNDGSYKSLAVFSSLDGNLYVVDHKSIAPDKMATGPDNLTKYPTPELVFKTHTSPSISTPIIIKNRIVTAGYQGLFLYEFDKNYNFKLLDSKNLGSMEATPVAVGGRVYIASRNGFLYCFGNKN